MPWSIKHRTDCGKDGDQAPPKPLRVGDAYYAPYYQRSTFWAKQLSPKYLKDHAHKRPPIVVFLPGRDEWCVDTLARKDGVPYGEGWTVTGSLEEGNLTLDPSVDMKGTWHGHIINGVITDDHDGRKYEDSGKLIQ